MNAQTPNEHNTRELELFAISNYCVYHDSTKHVLNNLASKVVRGNYNASKAPRAWYHVAVAAAKQYAREFSVIDDWHKLFSVADRKAVAHTLTEHYRSELIEHARAIIGPKIVTVELHDWKHDTYGNPTAHHTVISEGPCYSTRGGRRLQVGYSDTRDEGAREAMSKAGLRPDWYDIESAEIDRLGRSVIVFDRRDAAITHAVETDPDNET